MIKNSEMNGDNNINNNNDYRQYVKHKWRIIDTVVKNVADMMA